MATATPVDPTKAVLDTIKDIHANQETFKGELAEVKKQLATPVNTGATPNQVFARHFDDGRELGSFAPSNETVNLNFTNNPDAATSGRRSYKAARKHSFNQLRASNYVPYGEFKSTAEFIREGLLHAGHPKFTERCRSHFKAISGMSESIGADGGYTVLPEFSTRIMDRVFSNDLWGRTDNYTVTGNNMTFLANAETSRATGSRHGGLQGYWITEGASITSSKPTFRQVSIKLYDLAVVVYLTEDLVSDTGTALEEYVANKASDEFNFMIGDALVNGTGVGQPLGMTASPCLVSVAQEAGQGPTSLVSENVVKSFARVFAPCRDKMVWLHNQDIEPELFTMTIGVGTGGQVTYLPPGGLSSSPYAQLMGRPLVPTEFNATLGTTGDIIAADMSQILSISKGGIAQAVSLHVEFLTNQRALRFIMRVNATPWWNAPLTPYKGTANTQSCFVTLDTRS